jgi:hypothetical protein
LALFAYKHFLSTKCTLSIFFVDTSPLITYESGILGQAAGEKFFSATFLERKIMSTKTSFKRIALVAASALAIAGFSAVPAHAANGTATAIAIANTTTDDGVALASTKYTSNPVRDALQISAFEVVASSAVILHLTAVGGTFTADDSGKVTMSNATSNFGIVSASTVLAATADGIEDPLPVFTAPSVAGTYTLTVTVDNTTEGLGGYDADTDLTTSVTMVVVAASALNLGYSTAYMQTGANVDASTAADDLVAATATKSMATGTRASVTISLKDSNNVAMTTGNTITATMSGAGGVAALATLAMTANVPTADDCSATVVSRSISATADAVNTVSICSDGTSGVGTLTISVTNAAGVTAVLATKTITFYGSVAKLVATATYSIGKAGGGTTGDAAATRNLVTEIPAVIVKATDSAGNVVPGLTISALSSNTLILSSTITINGDTAGEDYSSGGAGFYNASYTTTSIAKSGEKATLTFRILDPSDAAGLAYLTSAVDITIGGTTVATETLSFDKATYATGESAIITLTAKDSSGNPVADETASPEVTFNKSVGGTYAASLYVAGKRANAVNTLFAPQTVGDFTALATSGNAAGSALSATSAVEGDQSASLALDAANAATDAANNAYDEAQNATQAASDALAAVTELATQVTSLIASVKKLTAAVAKLSKKK